MDYNSFICRLESKRQRLIEELEQLKASVPQTGGDEVDAAMEHLELEKKLTSQKRMRGDLAEVEHALAKFETGTYGLCDNCGLPIGTARLEALPQARLCLSCKAWEESGGKGGLIHQRERRAGYEKDLLNINAPDELAGVEEDLENYIAGGY